MMPQKGGIKSMQVCDLVAAGTGARTIPAPVVTASSRAQRQKCSAVPLREIIPCMPSPKDAF